MKMKIVYIFLGIFSFLVTACDTGGSYHHPDDMGSGPWDGSICFFQFSDTSYMSKIMLSKYSNEDYEFIFKYGKKLSRNYWILLYPKNLEGQPIFGETTRGGTSIDFDYLDGVFYTVKDVVESPKYIALKDGYYICYPFTALESYSHYINAEWKDFYNIDFDKFEMIPSHKVYKKRYHISERNLSTLTQKSTKHFPKEDTEMITIDDVVKTLNDLIETNRIDKFCNEKWTW